jgi:type I restriction enzyme S subunit
LALGKKRKAEEALTRTPYLRVDNVQRGYLDLSEIKTVLATAGEIIRMRLKQGDILMNEGGDRDKLGRGWVWNGDVDPCIHQNHVFRVRLYDTSFPPKYVSYFANEFGQDYFFSAGTQTTNLASISKTKLSSLPILVPPADEAVEIVRRSEVAFESINKLEGEANRGANLIAHLAQALLAKAFRGELVPQDPNDEPAETLLERIRMARETAPKPKRGRKRKEAAI